MGRALVVLVYACFPVFGWFMIAMMLDDWKMMDRNEATRGKAFGYLLPTALMDGN